MLHVALDFDEVIYPMLKCMEMHYKRNVKTNIPKTNVKAYDYSARFNMSLQESKQLVKSFYKDPCYTYAQPIQGSWDGINYLKKKYKLGIITGRQYYGRQCTEKYIAMYFPDTFDYVFCTNSYSLEGEEIEKKEVCKGLGVDVLVDDSVYNVDKVEEENVKGIVFGNYEWNQAENRDRVDGWENISDFL